ncbi:MAG: lipoyl synthase [Eubacteriales bacterium]|nr:lipoyl synthase [Eubacteriales bacterium]
MEKKVEKRPVVSSGCCSAEAGVRSRIKNPEAFPVIAKPKWLKVNYNAKDTREVMELMERLNLHTVCREANCPNLGECYRKRTATFMILGSICTRVCRFCNVCSGRPLPIDPDEPRHLAEAAKQLNLLHVVVTSVNRDDLADGGASQFVAVIQELRKALPQATVEVLIPDLEGNREALQSILEAEPDVLNHNIETVPHLYKAIRPQAKYQQSLDILRWSADYAHESYARRLERDPKARGRMLIKTGLMLGLGEDDEQLNEVFTDLVRERVDVLTLGQYLRPTEFHAPVKRYVTPDKFEEYREQALAAGLGFVAASPMVRSSYRAEEALAAVRAKEAAALHANK